MQSESVSAVTYIPELDATCMYKAVLG